MAKKKVKNITPEVALAKLQRYCAYQDRCHQEVRNRLLELGMYGDELEAVIADLISENFLNEERFARSYARGKFRMKYWGKNRIRLELKRRNISEYCIRKAFEEIEEEGYLPQLRQLFENKKKQIKQKDNLFLFRQKLAQYALRRGFEPELVWKVVKEVEME